MNALSIRAAAFAVAVMTFAAGGAFVFDARAGNFAPSFNGLEATAYSLATPVAAKRRAGSQRQLGFKGGGTSRGGAGCHGAINCADLSKTLVKNGNTCKSWTCNNDGGKPSCWCDL